jgi:hypothetical protein
MSRIDTAILKGLRITGVREFYRMEGEYYRLSEMLNEEMLLIIGVGKGTWFGLLKMLLPRAPHLALARLAKI